MTRWKAGDRSELGKHMSTIALLMLGNHSDLA
jgi:hypothetical protein